MYVYFWWSTRVCVRVGRGEVRPRFLNLYPIQFGLFACARPPGKGPRRNEFDPVVISVDKGGGGGEGAII